MIFSNYDTVSNCSSPSMCMCKKIHLQILFLKVQCQIHTRGISVSASQTWKLLLSKMFLHKNYYSWGKCFLTKYLRAQNMHKIFLQPQNLIVFFFFQVSQQKSNVCVLFLFFSWSDTCEQSFSHALQNLEMMAVELLVNIIFMSLDYRGPWFASMQLSFFSFLFFFFFGITVPCDEPECCLLFLYRLSGLRE